MFTVTHNDITFEIISYTKDDTKDEMAILRHQGINYSVQFYKSGAMWIQLENLKDLNPATENICKRIKYTILDDIKYVLMQQSQY
jgi:hypothetical protein